MFGFLQKMIYLRHRDNKIGDGVNVGRALRVEVQLLFLAVNYLRIAKKKNLRPST